MQLPIDIKALFDEMTDIGEASKTPLSVSVYIDGRAEADLVAHVRNAYASQLSTVRMTLSYLDDTFSPKPTDDVAILVAGESQSVGAAAAALRAVGVPTMVVCSTPASVAVRAESSGHAIPEGDLVSVAEPGATEPVPLDDEKRAALNDRMGRWIVAACREKRLALSLAFPFVRKPLARDAVQMTCLQNAGIGLVPLIPGADLPIMTLNQAKMVLQIAATYGRSMDKGRFKEIIAIVGGGLISRTIARELVELVPVLGFVIRPAVAYGATAAMGYGVIEYFEGGENVVGVANVVSRAGEVGGKVVSTVREKAVELEPLVSELAGQQR